MVTSSSKAEVVDKTEITPEGAALMEFTSDTTDDNKVGDLKYITSKGAYIWAGLAVYLVKNTLPTRVENIAIHSAIYSAVNNPRQYSISALLNDQELPKVRIDTKQLAETGHTYQDNDVVYQNQNRQCIILIQDILHNLDLNITDIDDADKLNSYIKTGYDELIEKSLIIDPIIETTLGLAILSLLPFSFVKRTKKGQLQYRKIQAAAWKYEMSRKSGGVQTNLTFEVARIAKALKVGLIAAYHQATSSEGDEPDEIST